MDSLLMKSIGNFYWEGSGAGLRSQIVQGYTYLGNPNQALGHTYVYGSKIRRLADDQVEFSNPFLPAGTVIYRWDEAINYGGGRATPALPLLKRGQRYQVRCHAKVENGGAIYLRLLFFNFTGQRVAMKIIRQASGSFDYPIEADYYAVELLGTGAPSLVFERIDIVAVDQDAPLKTDK